MTDCRSLVVMGCEDRIKWGLEERRRVSTERRITGSMDSVEDL